MPRICYYCGKGPIFGNKITRRGLAKKKGGVGQKITGITKRKFKPNLQKVKAFVGGKTRSINVCTRCITHGKVVKPIKVKTKA